MGNDEVAISEVEKFERLMNKAVRKWLGLPCCLSTIALYGKGILEFAMTSLVENFKCAKTSLEMALSQFKDPVVKDTAPVVKTGRKWNLRDAAQHTQGEKIIRISLARNRVEEQNLH